jgi:hypothetical protein
MNFVFIAVAAAGMLAGCAAADLRKDGAKEGAKEGATYADYQGDIRSCESMAVKNFPSGDPSMSNAVSIEVEQAMRRRQYTLACMESRGWR